MLLFKAVRISDGLLYDVEIHQRFAAEKIQFQIMPCAGMRNQKIHRAFGDGKRHQHALAAEVPLCGETIPATQIAVVRDI